MIAKGVDIQRLKLSTYNIHVNSTHAHKTVMTQNNCICIDSKVYAEILLLPKFEILTLSKPVGYAVIGAERQAEKRIVHPTSSPTAQGTL